MKYHVYESMDALVKTYRIISEDSSISVLRTTSGRRWDASTMSRQNVETGLRRYYRKLGVFNNIKLK